MSMLVGFRVPFENLSLVSLMFILPSLHYKMLGKLKLSRKTFQNLGC